MKPSNRCRAVLLVASFALFPFAANAIIPEMMLPNEVDPSEPMCVEGVEPTFDQWEPIDTQVEYRVALELAEQAAMNKCRNALVKFKEDLEVNDPIIDSPFVQDPKHPGLDARYTAESTFDRYRVRATAQIVCKTCELVSHTVEQAFGCNSEPESWPYKTMLEWRLDRYSKLKVYGVAERPGVNAYYCHPLSLREKATVVLSAAQFCDLPCQGECLDKYYESTQVIKRDFKGCEFHFPEGPSDVFNPTHKVASELKVYTNNPDPDGYACDPLVMSPLSDTDTNEIRNICDFIVQGPGIFESGLSSPELNYEDLVQEFEDTKVKPIFLFYKDDPTEELPFR